MTKIDLDMLDQIATAATQDEWQWRDDDVRDDVLEGVHDAQVVLYASDDGGSISASISDRAHIAAASPPVVRALIARIRELEAGMDQAADVIELAGLKFGSRRLRALIAEGTVLP